jgi:hypothetical protein
MAIPYGIKQITSVNSSESGPALMTVITSSIVNIASQINDPTSIAKRNGLCVRGELEDAAGRKFSIGGWFMVSPFLQVLRYDC